MSQTEIDDAALLKWMQEQNEAPINAFVQRGELKEHAQMFISERGLQFYLTANGLTETAKVVQADTLVPLVGAWIDSITERPVVLSVREFNDHAHLTLGLYYTQADLLDAYEQAVTARFPHRFECAEHIQIAQWKGFFEQYGGSGVVAGTIERAKPMEINMQIKRRATYYFSEANEAMFARVAFV